MLQSSLSQSHLDQSYLPTHAALLQVHGPLASGGFAPYASLVSTRASEALASACPGAALHAACVPGCVQLLVMAVQRSGIAPPSAQQLAQVLAEVLPAGSFSRITSNSTAGPGTGQDAGGTAGQQELRLCCAWPPCLVSGQQEAQQLVLLLETPEAVGCKQGSQAERDVRVVVAGGGLAGAQEVVLDVTCPVQLGTQGTLRWAPAAAAPLALLLHCC